MTTGMNEHSFEKAVAGWNDTARDYPRDKTAVELFEEQVALHPDKVAVFFNDTGYTYRELNERANRVAHCLRARGGVLRDQPVAIYIRRGFDMLAGIWGILKSGGAYVPVEPGEAAARLRHKIVDCGCSLVLTDSAAAGDLKALAGESGFDMPQLVCLDDAAALAECAADNPARVNSPADLAYVIYTSGSTGKPKGVAIEHRSLVEKVCAMRQDYGMDENTVLLLRTTFMFDVSLLETTGIFMSGGQGVLVGAAAQRDAGELVRLMEKYAVSTVQLTPGYLGVFEGERLPDSALNWFVAGEALAQGTAQAFLRDNPGKRLVNFYGPTETTIYATGAVITPENAGRITIGKPMANTTCYILDEKMHPVSVGSVGELYIGGAGLARGYINNPEFTAARFVDNPFSAPCAENFKFQISNFPRLYRSGDLCRWLPDGNIEFIGRADFQVKIRGYRIEPGEIEKALQVFPGIRQAVVTVVENNGEKQLAAYYTLAEGQTAAVEKIREYLLSEIPDYMVPEFLVELDELPQNSNGKVDRSGLPAPFQAQQREEYQAPCGETEKYIAALWAEALKIDERQISALDNFFRIGGDSLKAIRVARKLMPVPASALFEHPTLAEYARFVERLRATANDPAAVDAAGQEADIAAARAAYAEKLAGMADLQVRQRRISKALLAGATGYLGAYLLRELFLQNVDEVVCIVRAKTDEAARERLLQKLQYYFPGCAVIRSGLQRLRAWAGDCARPQLGLDGRRYRSLKTVDTVFNCAANVRYYGNGESFYAANVSTAERLAEFALQAGAVLQHVSTVSVFERRPYEPRGFYTEYDFSFSTTTDKIYVKTKRCAEEKIRGLAAKGLKANIFRAGNIVMAHDGAALQQNVNENAFYNLVRAFSGLGFVPRNLQLDFSHVDAVAAAIVRLSATDAAGETFHVYNPALRDLSVLLPEIVPGISVVSWQELAELLNENRELPWYSYFTEALELACGQLAGNSADDITELTAEKTQLWLKQCGFSWPDAARQVLKSYAGTKGQA